MHAPRANSPFPQRHAPRRVTRRRFLGGAAAAFGGLVLGTPARPATGAAPAPRRPAGAPAFDLHCHPGLFIRKGGPEYPGDEAVAMTVADMHTGGLAGGFFALVADAKILVLDPDGPHAARPFEPGEAWADYERQLGVLNDLLATLPADPATQAADLEAFPVRGRVAAYIACEGGDCLEGRPDRLDRMYAAGVRSLQLVHYVQNDLGDLQTAPPKYNGLSETGREAVRAMNRLGMVIDVAHAAFSTVRAVAELTEHPIILSHSQLKTPERQHPRLIDADHARVVAETGGVIGMWPSGFGNDTFDEFVDHTLRLVDVVGVDHVGLGTDMDGNYRPVFDTYRQLPGWIAALQARGLSEEEAGRIAGGNALRVLQQVL